MATAGDERRLAGGTSGVSGSRQNLLLSSADSEEDVASSAKDAVAVVRPLDMEPAVYRQQVFGLWAADKLQMEKQERKKNTPCCINLFSFLCACCLGREQWPPPEISTAANDDDDDDDV
eukprot:COSAG06_NODE_751_length_12582_cov_40.259072_3_plen_119_part_00